MTTNQTKAAERLLKTLQRSRELLLNTNTAGCDALQQINRMALDSNQRAIDKLLAWAKE